MSGFCFMLCTLYKLKPFITSASKRSSKKVYAKHPYVVKTKLLHEYGLSKIAHIGMPDCWFRRVLRLATTVHFRLFRYSKCWVGTQNPRCNAVFLCKAPSTNSKIPARTPLSSSPPVIIISALLSSAAHFHNYFTSHYHLHFSMLCLDSSLPLPEGRAGIAWENSGQ